MYGGTYEIEEHLSHFRNVIFLAPTRDEKDWIFRNAIDRYKADHVKIEGRRHLIDFGSAFLRFLHLDGSRRTIETIQSSQAVTIIHPDLLFEHGRDEELLEMIKHRNEQYGLTKPRTT